MVAAAYASVAKVYRRLGHRQEKARALEDDAKKLLRIAEENPDLLARPPIQPLNSETAVSTTSLHGVTCGSMKHLAKVIT